MIDRTLPPGTIFPNEPNDQYPICAACGNAIEKNERGARHYLSMMSLDGGPADPIHKTCRDLYYQERKPIRCFMDGIDFQHHLLGDADGTKLYPSEDALRAGKKCLANGGCGVVEVEVRLVRWVEAQDLRKGLTKL